MQELAEDRENRPNSRETTNSEHLLQIWPRQPSTMSECLHGQTFFGILDWNKPLAVTRQLSV